MSDGLTQVRNGKEPQKNDHDGCRYRDEHRESPGVLGAEKIQSPDEQNRSGCKKLRMRHSQIEEGGEGTDSRRNDVVGDKQEGPDDRDDLGAVTHACIDTTTVRIMTADGDVIESYQGRQQAHHADEPRGAVARHGEGQTNDVGLAGSPVSVKDRRRPLPVDVTRSGRRAEFHHEKLSFKGDQ